LFQIEERAKKAEDERISAELEVQAALLRLSQKTKEVQFISVEKANIQTDKEM
jgi:hypothetical protein